jgi:hypothetical protein
MSSFSRLLTIAFGLTAAGCAVLAYQQYVLRQTAQDNVAALEKERTALRARVAQLEKNRSERPRWATATSSNSGDLPVPAGGNGDPGAPQPVRGDGPGGFGRMRAMMESPQAQQFMAMQQKAALDGRYGALFRKLNLSPSDLEKLKNLLVERQTAALDVMTAARNQGVDLRSSSQEISQLVREAQAEVDQSIRSTIGDTGYQAYQDYERTLPARGAVNQLEQRLSYTSTPLRADQSDQLAQIIADTSPSRANGGRAANGFFVAAEGAAAVAGAAFFSGGATITDDAVTRAQGVLTSDQLAAFKQLQAEQQARAQLTQDMRRNFGRPGTATTGAASSDAPLPSPPGGG